MRKVVAAFAFLAMGQALAAATLGGWERVRSDDGRVSVATPCASRDLVRNDYDGGGYRLSCEWEGLSFNISVGMPSKRGNKVIAYDELLSSARAELNKRFVQESTIQGRRAFGVSCSDLTEDTPCVWFVDLPESAPLMISVFSANGVGKAKAGTQKANTNLANAFYQSLELKL